MVPVLSIHKISILPKLLIAFKFLTITSSFFILFDPLARQVVTIIGRSSGVNPMETVNAKINASNQLFFVNPLIKKTIGIKINMKITSNLEILEIFFSNVVFSLFSLFSVIVPK